MQTPVVVAKRLCSSTAVLMLVFLISFSLLVQFTKPLDQMFWTGLTAINQNILVSKLPDIIFGGENADVLMLGSSLLLYPTVRVDDQFRGRRTRWDTYYQRHTIYPYSQAQFLQDQLSKRLRASIKLANAGVVASVVSDQYLILKKYLAEGKRPKLLLICTEPRAFYDNERTEIQKSATYSLLADVNTLPEILANNPSPQDLFDFGLGKIWHFYRTRNDYRGFLVSLAVKVTGHPASIYTAVNNQLPKATGEFEDEQTRFNPDAAWEVKPIYEQPENTLGQLSQYRSMYNPLNSKQFKTQCNYLDQLLALAKEHRISVLVVNMPLPGENLCQLPSGALEQYKEALETACAKWGANYWDPGSGRPYTVSDFEDCAHLNQAGAAKFYRDLVEHLCQSKESAIAIRGERSWWY